MSFHPGQKVVCVDDTPAITRGIHTAYLEKGKVYTIRRCADWPFWTCFLFGRPEIPGVWLAEIVRPLDHSGREHPFSAVRFRPLDEARLDQFRVHLAPINQREEA